MAVRRGTFDSPGGGIGSSAEMPSALVLRLFGFPAVCAILVPVPCAVEDVKVVIKVPVTTTGIEWNANIGVVAFDVRVHVSIVSVGFPSSWRCFTVSLPARYA